MATVVHTGASQRLSTDLKPNGDTVTKALAPEMIEGFQTEGRLRVRATVATGTKPVLVSTEEWVSKELQVALRSVVVDSQGTKTTSSFTHNHVGTSPGQDLFEIPPGYKVIYK